jgi:L-ribulose-5-phosphate 3-epimerase
MEKPIGFMQGRLSPLINGKIQAFPWNNWEEEFEVAHKNNFKIMEWTLDQERLYENPLMCEDGQKKINNLSEKYELLIPSITGDCFMQAPFFKCEGKIRESLINDLQNIITSCAVLGINIIVFPLVDKGSIENSEQEKILLSNMARLENDLSRSSILIVFESDYTPIKLKNFIDQLSPESFGINYDIGNSASMGFDPIEEIETYGQRILNVHIKDRLFNGATVPLGSGDANIPKVFYLLKSIEYNGYYILQTARAKDNDHAATLCQYREKASRWLKEKKPEHGFKSK